MLVQERAENSSQLKNGGGREGPTKATKRLGNFSCQSPVIADRLAQAVQCGAVSAFQCSAAQRSQHTVTTEVQQGGIRGRGNGTARRLQCIQRKERPLRLALAILI